MAMQKKSPEVNIKSINWRRVILNLRSYAGMTAKKVSQVTGVKEVKISRMATDGCYNVSLEEAIAILDCHFDTCHCLHTANRLVMK